MIRSMTGYGHATHEDARLRVSVEVKTINAKQADASLRLPSTWAAHELSWRQLAIARLGRGKITLAVSYERKEAPLPLAHLHPARFRAYYQALQALAAEVGASSQGLFQQALQAPEVRAQADPTTSCAADLPLLERTIQAALQQCDQSRQTEGAALATQLRAHWQHIEQGLAQVAALAPAREQAIREKLHTSAQALAPAQGIDENRLAQELLYYLERLDITEEQVRLAQHLAYFEEVLQHPPQAAGKKLGFIAQEIGREINTMGAKANDAAIQKAVVLMKDALEKIKEQLQNIV